jgi:hypothetical protein
LRRLASGAQEAQVVSVAATLGLADSLADGSGTVTDLEAAPSAAAGPS